MDLTLKEKGMFATRADKKFYVKHEKGVLVLVCSAHMDDFKASGEMKWLLWLQDILQKAFGSDVKLDLSREFVQSHARWFHVLGPDRIRSLFESCGGQMFVSTI